MTEKKEEEKKKGESEGVDGKDGTSTDSETKGGEENKGADEERSELSKRLTNIERNYAKAFERSTASGGDEKSLDFTTSGLNANVYTLNEIQGYIKSQPLEA